MPPWTLLPSSNYVALTPSFGNPYHIHPCDEQFINLSLELSEERQSRKVLEWLRAVIILIDSLGTFKFTPGTSRCIVLGRGRNSVGQWRVRVAILWYVHATDSSALRNWD